MVKKDFDRNHVEIDPDENSDSLGVGQSSEQTNLLLPLDEIGESNKNQNFVLISQQQQTTTKVTAHASEGNPLEEFSKEQAEAIALYFRRDLIWLSVYAFLCSFKPSESFLSPYFLQQGFSSQQIDDQIYPIWSYSYLAFLIVLGPLAEISRYKPVLVAGVLFRLATRLLLILCTSPRLILLAQLSQITYGASSAVEAVMLAYVFSLAGARRDRYARLAGSIKAVYLAGHVASSILGQVLVSYFSISITILMYIAMVPVLLSLPVSIFALRRPPNSLSSITASSSSSSSASLTKKKFRIDLKSRFSSFLSILSSLFFTTLISPRFIAFSTFYVLIYAIEQLFLNYFLVLIALIDSNAQFGFVDSAGRLAAALANCILLIKFFAPSKKPIVRNTQPLPFIFFSV